MAGDRLTYWSRPPFRRTSATVVLSDAFVTVELDQLADGALFFRALTVTMVVRDEEHTLTFAPVTAGRVAPQAHDDERLLDLKRRLDALAASGHRHSRGHP